VYRLFIHQDAEEDLEQIWDSEPDAAARILVMLEECEGNQGLLDRLTQHEFGARGVDEFNVSRWQERWHKGDNLWRLKVWDLEDKDLRYRIIYAFIPQSRHYHVLAIAPRDFNYDPSHPLYRRIINTYQEL